MANQRIKGQEVEVMVVVDGRALSTVTDVRSFEVGPQLEIKREGYLGETTDRRDEIFNGVTGRMELHFENQDIFGLFTAVVDRARRRTPGVKINIKATLNFPGGDRPRVLINDAFFGPFPINFAGRGDYGAVTVDFESSDISFITA